MANDMREEFEEYVKKLTTAICRDIFLEKLEELYHKYEEEYELYSKATTQAAAAGKSLQKELKGTTSFLKDIDRKTGESISSVNQSISRMEASTGQLFSEMRVLNEQKSADFISELSACIAGYKKELADIFEDEGQKISDKLAGVITPEILQHFLDVLEANTRETKELAAFVGGEYKKEIEKSIKGIVDANHKAMEETNVNVSAYVREMTATLNGTQKEAEEAIDGKVKAFLETIAKYIKVEAQCFNNFIQVEKKNHDEALEEQKKLISQIGPSDEKIMEFEQRVIRLEGLVNDMKVDNESANRSARRVYEQLLVGQEEMADKQYENMELMKRESAALSQREYRTTSFTIMLTGLILILELFHVFGMAGGIIVIGIVATAVALIPETRDRIIWFIKNKLKERR